MLRRILRASVTARLAALLAVLAGLACFRLGFLLTRTTLPDKSDCAAFAPFPNASFVDGSGCWAPRPHAPIRRAVVVIIDALRYDFAAWDPLFEAQPDAVTPDWNFYRNKLPVLHNVTNGHARLFRCRADPPTTTLQRLKAMTTGSLPTFIDMSSNFGSDEIAEDSIPYQVHAAGANLTFMGDDTWMGLFPRYLAHAWPFPSFDVWDLHTVDNGVIAHLYDELAKDNWHVLVGHFLGVDHVGHRYKPAHPTMPVKLRQLNGVLVKLTEELPDDTVLIVLGDHGMDAKGDHGGDSVEETDTALWIFSKTDIFSSSIVTDTVNQIDVVPTLSLLLGLPIPMENLGSIIPDVFPDPHAARAVNARQIRRYIDRYSEIAPDLREHIPRLREIVDPLEFIQATLEACRSVWAQFHTPGMIAGIVLMLLGLVVLAASLWSEVRGEAAKWTVVAAVPAAIYAANSFILYEDALFFYLLQSALVVAAVRSPAHRAALMVAIVVNTTAFQITVCREEQIGCRNTFHTTTLGTLTGFTALIAKTWRSTGATWRTRILGALLVAYWLVEEEFAGTVDRVWPVWIARVHVALVAVFSLTHHRSEREGTLLLYCLLAQFHRPVGMLALWAADTTLSALPAPTHPMTHVVAHCLIRFAYFASGHQATLSSIHWSVGHTGMYTTNFVLSPIAVALNTVGHVIPLVAVVPSPWALVALETVHLIGSSAMAMHLRRHLMVWKVFAPRWMLSGLLLVTVAGVAVVVDAVRRYQRRQGRGAAHRSRD
ncbi:hypothetical protein GGF32_009895 [Allomyces javanicus]|nr:hypothetical protein GGF32_009895 [Allomyces javanicus]